MTLRTQLARLRIALDSIPEPERHDLARLTCAELDTLERHCLKVRGSDEDGRTADLARLSAAEHAEYDALDAAALLPDQGGVNDPARATLAALAALRWPGTSRAHGDALSAHVALAAALDARPRDPTCVVAATTAGAQVLARHAAGAVIP